MNTSSANTNISNLNTWCIRCYEEYLNEDDRSMNNKFASGDVLVEWRFDLASLLLNHTNEI